MMVCARYKHDWADLEDNNDIKDDADLGDSSMRIQESSSGLDDSCNAMPGFRARKRAKQKARKLIEKIGGNHNTGQPFKHTLLRDASDIL